MKYLSVDHVGRNYQGEIFGNIACESAEPTDLQYQIKKVKRYRSAFTTGQINYLENQFKKCPYIGSASRKEVASALNISERAIKIWFQNRRMKEKKESIRKEEEYNLDRQNNLINNVPFTNDSLNNVHSSQSTNDIQRSLQIAVSHIKDKIDCMSHDDAFYGNVCNSYVDKSKRGITGLMKSNDVSKSNILKNKKIINKDYFQTTGNLAKDNLHKGEIKSTMPKINKTTVIQPATETDKDLPEDLSAHKTASPTKQNHQENMSYNTTYIPFCSTQNYYTPCFSSGNVLWKPVNIMPIMPNGLPTTILQSQHSGIHQMQTQLICSCKCHLKNSRNDEGMNIPQPQYVIAMPFHNHAQ